VDLQDIYRQIVETLNKARIGFNINSDCFKNIRDQEFKPGQSNGSGNDSNNSDSSESDSVR